MSGTVWEGDVALLEEVHNWHTLWGFSTLPHMQYSSCFMIRLKAWSVVSSLHLLPCLSPVAMPFGVYPSGNMSFNMHFLPEGVFLLCLTTETGQWLIGPISLPYHIPLSCLWSKNRHLGREPVSIRTTLSMYVQNCISRHFRGFMFNIFKVRKKSQASTKKKHLFPWNWIYNWDFTLQQYSSFNLHWT